MVQIIETHLDEAIKIAVAFEAFKVSVEITLPLVLVVVGRRLWLLRERVLCVVVQSLHQATELLVVRRERVYSNLIVHYF